MVHYIQKPTIISLKIALQPDLMESFAAWQAKLNQAIVAERGFISLEFLCPKSGASEWLIVQRFASQSEVSAWRASPFYLEMIGDLKKLTVENELDEIVSDEAALNAGATEVIIAEVHPKQERAYREWIAKIHQEEAKAQGFRGVYVQSPMEGKRKFWVTLLQFDTMENLDRWLSSSERRQLLSQSEALISHLETHRVISPYAGWFASIAKIGELPPLWKQTMLVLLVLFPIVMLEFKYLLPLLAGYNLAFTTFIGNAISVTLISFPMMPMTLYFLNWWLLPQSKNRNRIELIGLVFVCLLYLIELALFWNFI